MGGPEEDARKDPGVCSSCATLMDDIQDPAIIESAVPREGSFSSHPLAEAQAGSDRNRTLSLSSMGSLR